MTRHLFATGHREPRRVTELTVLCAWCQTLIRGRLKPGEVVSHGICQTCSRALERGEWTPDHPKPAA